MTKGKNYNSILFLTTLGVYLGLVLVGGTAPQVLAHSALTRNFEISDEIEFNDELDTKPDAIADNAGRFVPEIDDAAYAESVRSFLNRISTPKQVPGGFAFTDGELYRQVPTAGDYASRLERSVPQIDQPHFAVVSRLPRASIDDPSATVTR